MSIAHSPWLEQAAMGHMWRQEVTAENHTSGQDRASRSWLLRGASLGFLSLSFSERSYYEHEVGVLGIAGLLMMDLHS